MALQTIDRNIIVDFYDTKYMMINAKQYDTNSRRIIITCYNQGNIFNLNASKHFAYVRFKKADEKVVFNFCSINSRGQVIVELTEQMLFADGICYVDLVIVNKGDAIINVDTGEIIAIDNSSILSTMAFCVNTYETSVDNTEIESSSEFEGLGNLLQRAEADYEDVVTTSKSWAVGNTGVRSGENTDNAKYYYEQSLVSANNAKTSETKAKTSETNAKTSETNALASETKAKTSETNAQTYMNNAKTSETNALASETKAKTSETNAKTSEANAQTYMNNAKTSETNAKTSETNSQSYMNNAKTSEANALNSYNLSKSYAVGGTGVRENEDMNNAKYYCDVVKNVVDSLNSGFIPMGTITFSQLATAEKATGFTYNISDDFVTDDSFAEGAGKTYTAGVNVYYRADGLWDCQGGSSPATATVEEVKTYLGIDDSGEIM